MKNKLFKTFIFLLTACSIAVFAGCDFLEFPFSKETKPQDDGGKIETPATLPEDRPDDNGIKIGKPVPQPDDETDEDQPYIGEAASGGEPFSAANSFELKIFSDKDSYNATNEIKIWATLEYIGDEDEITIWHGLPYISFSITDGKDFNVEGLCLQLLTSTVLNKGEIYTYNYQKSGGYSASDPAAAFWESFYKQKELFLPAGEYVVSVYGAFYLSDSVIGSESGLSCRLPIKVY